MIRLRNVLLGGFVLMLFVYPGQLVVTNQPEAPVVAGAVIVVVGLVADWYAQRQRQ